MLFKKKKNQLMLTFSFHVHYHLNKLWYLHTYFLIIYIWNKGKTIKVENIVLNLTKILVSLFRLFCVQDGHFYKKTHETWNGNVEILTCETQTMQFSSVFTSLEKQTEECTIYILKATWLNTWLTFLLVPLNNWRILRLIQRCWKKYNSSFFLPIATELRLALFVSIPLLFVFLPKLLGCL